MKPILFLAKVGVVGLSSTLAVLTALFLLFRLPSGPPADHFAGLEIAHRGGYEWGPENTLFTLNKAFEKGVKAVEIDIAYTADSVLVLFHDERVDALTPDTGLIYTKKWEQVAALQVRDADGMLSMETVLSLEDFLEILPDSIVVEFDLKHWLPDQGFAVDALVEQMRKHRITERSFISSFDPRVLYSLRKQHPDLHTAFAISPESGMGSFMDMLLQNPWVPQFLGVRIIEPHHSQVSPGYISYWKSKGMIVNAWTVNDKKQKEQLLAWGASVTSNCPLGNCPDRIQDQWPPAPGPVEEETREGGSEAETSR